jgi:hypothetical protein
MLDYQALVEEHRDTVELFTGLCVLWQRNKKIHSIGLHMLTGEMAWRTSTYMHPKFQTHGQPLIVLHQLPAQGERHTLASCMLDSN